MRQTSAIKDCSKAELTSRVDGTTNSELLVKWSSQKVTQVQKLVEVRSMKPNPRSPHLRPSSVKGGSKRAGNCDFKTRNGAGKIPKALVSWEMFDPTYYFCTSRGSWATLGANDPPEMQPRQWEGNEALESTVASSSLEPPPKKRRKRGKKENRPPKS